LAEPLTPNFAEPGSFIRYYGQSVVDPRDKDKRLRFVQLQEGEGPQRYPFKFATVAVDANGNSVTFSDLDPANGHVEEVFLGVAPGIRAKLSLPFDTRLLKWDTTLQNISDDQAAVLTHGLSPYEAPTFEFWIPPNKNYPAIVPQNATADLLNWPGGKSIFPRVIFIGKTFIVEEMTGSNYPDVYVMLLKKKIPSRPITLGGSIRTVPH
jgi:hypothetical protein